MAGVTGLEPATSGVTGRRSNQSELHPQRSSEARFRVLHGLLGVKMQREVSGLIWWAMTGSNRRPPRCKRGALPTELIAPIELSIQALSADIKKNNADHPVIAGIIRELDVISLVNGFLQSFPSLEFRNVRSLDLYSFASPWVAALCRLAMANAERAEPN